MFGFGRKKSKPSLLASNQKLIELMKERDVENESKIRALMSEVRDLRQSNDKLHRQFQDMKIAYTAQIDEYLGIIEELKSKQR